MLVQDNIHDGSAMSLNIVELTALEIKMFYLQKVTFFDKIEVPEGKNKELSAIYFFTIIIINYNRK